VRFADNASQLHYQHYDLAYFHELNKHFELELSYRQIFERKGGKFRPENVPNINAIVKWDMADFKFDNRFRLEYRHFDYQSDSWRFRDKFTLNFPWKLTKYKIQPYLSDEGFLDLNGIEFAKNRFYAGFKAQAFENVRVEIYYLLQATKSSNQWIDANVFGSKVKITF